MPAARYAIITSPEQSNASGPVPPHRYGLPICCWANLIAVPTAAVGVTRASSVPVPVHEFDDPEPEPPDPPGLTALTVNPPVAYVDAQDRTSATYQFAWLYA